LIEAISLSPVTKLVEGTGAVSRYNLSRSQKFVKVQDFNCGQMRVSGCNNNYKFVLSAGAKAKSVTNNLPILSVLGFRAFLVMLSRNCLFDKCLDSWILEKSLKLSPSQSLNNQLCKSHYVRNVKYALLVNQYCKSKLTNITPIETNQVDC
jgi:hypothetical protein